MDGGVRGVAADGVLSDSQTNLGVILENAFQTPSRAVFGVFPQVFVVGLSIGRQKRRGTRFRSMREHGVNGRERSGTP